MKEGVDILESILGAELFHKYVHVLLTDEGQSFLLPKLWRPHLMVQDGQGYFTAILCSQGKKARWKTNI